MALGMGSLGKKSSKAKKDNKSASAPKSDNDAAEVLKKMEAKSDAEGCVFC